MKVATTKKGWIEIQQKGATVYVCWYRAFLKVIVLSTFKEKRWWCNENWCKQHLKKQRDILSPSPSSASLVIHRNGSIRYNKIVKCIDCNARTKWLQSYKHRRKTQFIRFKRKSRWEGDEKHHRKMENKRRHTPSRDNKFYDIFSFLFFHFMFRRVRQRTTFKCLAKRTANTVRPKNNRAGAKSFWRIKVF